MKKSLFALAAIGAFSGAAQAQSSVTVYGILDVGYIGGNSYSSSGSTTSKGNWSEFATAGAESTSRLGFRGTEDLGGGNSAFFTVEVGLAGDTTAVLGGTRLAFAGLAKKGLGNFAIGTQNTFVHQINANINTGQLNNIAGSVLYPAISSPVYTSPTGSGQTDAYTVRTSNTLQVSSERISGFQAKAMYVLNNENGTKTAANTATGGSVADNGTTNYTGWGVSADFTWQKLYAAVAYQALKSETPYYVNGTTYTPANAAWTTTTGGSNTQDNQMIAGAAYDFGILKAYAGYVKRKASVLSDSNNYLQRTAQEIGVRGMLTKQVEYWGSVGNGRFSAFGSNQPTANFTAYQVGSNYLLSKRTNLYAIFGSNQTSSTSNGAFSVNNYAVGVRHTF